MIRLWFPAPNLKDIPPLLEEILPLAIESSQGLCERSSTTGIYQIALPEVSEEHLELNGVGLVTPYRDRESSEVVSIGVGSKLIADFAEKALENFSIDILRFRPKNIRAPQRIREKLARFVTLRPNRVQDGSTTVVERLWIHSAFMVGLESLEEGLSVRHFLQDVKGRFLPSPDSHLQRLDRAMLGEDFERLSELPKELRTEWETSIQREWLVGEFAQDLERNETEEISKAAAYYDSLEYDLRSRLLRSPKRSVIETLHRKLEAVKRESETRIFGIRERHRSQLLFKPIGSRCLILPTYCCEIRPERGEKAALLRVLWCPLLREFLAIECPSCGKHSRDFTAMKEVYHCTKCL